MRLPNKVICYNESILSKFPLILNILQNTECPIIELYRKLQNCIDIKDFIDALDCLFALGKININHKTRSIYYVV